MIITLNFIQWAVIIFYFLIGATLALIMYLVFMGTVATLYQAIKWVLEDEKK